MDPQRWLRVHISGSTTSAVSSQSVNLTIQTYLELYLSCERFVCIINYIPESHCTLYYITTHILLYIMTKSWTPYLADYRCCTWPSMSILFTNKSSFAFKYDTTIVLLTRFTRAPLHPLATTRNVSKSINLNASLIIFFTFYDCIS